MRRRESRYIVGLFIIFVFLVWFEGIASAQEEEKVRLALIDFSMTGQGIKELVDLDKIVHQWLTTFLVETRAFEIVERQELEKVLQEQSLGQTGILNSESAAQVGAILGVNILITGTLISFEDTLETTVRMIDTTNGSIVGTASVVTEDKDELRSDVKRLAEMIRKKLSIPRVLADIKIHETFDEEELSEERWYVGYEDGFKKSDKKQTKLVVQDGVLKIRGKYRKDHESRIFWLVPSLAEAYHSFEAKIRLSEITGNVAICVGATWYGDDEEENWTGICPYWEEDYGDVDIAIEEEGEEDSSTVKSEIETDQWYTVRIDFIDMQFSYYWNDELIKRITPKMFVENVELDITFVIDETRSVVIEIDEIILR